MIDIGCCLVVSGQWSVVTFMHTCHWSTSYWHLLWHYCKSRVVVPSAERLAAKTVQMGCCIQIICIYKDDCLAAAIQMAARRALAGHGWMDGPSSMPQAVGSAALI
jgi:hypothetical protein